ncbi:MAG: FKBP-type peptidyl-prolyl cis-trans isomerase [Melioribacteraceae bacterium]|nr:FKBP-type peptidyl-prolyl cis-trans isomerase [Melioribacteraceae bacterium]MCF8356365.1 FKBP-type peptidyl-prolyl cis-trans isomerase [Melioribacteraceae bacterium]MCF8392267.1 FKBP-type peptidyl-prolyl cis-trans isomerase [Melioribacteraceae bacterium]MCF8417599.1 FKBP-type peptidyl-prolyl cis-trans isomerase [Melioribacteraceae bacterium]
MKLLKVFAVILISASFASCQNNSNEPKELKTELDQVSYAIGTDIGKNFKKQDIEIDFDAFLQGLREGMGDSLISMTDQETSEVLMNYQKKMIEEREAKTKIESEKNKTEGEAFLKENAAKEGVVTTESGLQYKVLKEGSGAKPKPTDKVQVHYKGTFINGDTFDSSYDRGEPIEFPVNGVIKGWTEALQLMPVGSKYMLYVPSDLAYGPRGNQAIPANSTLIFEVELLDIVQ